MQRVKNHADAATPLKGSLASFPEPLPMSEHSSRAYHLASLGSLLDIRNDLLLLLLQLHLLPIQFALRFVESPLMSPKGLCWRFSSKQHVLM